MNSITISWQVLAVVAGVIIISVLIYLAAKGKLNFKSKWLAVESTNKQSLYKVITKAIMISNAIRDIESKDRINAQMDYCEIGIANNLATCMDKYAEVLTSKGVKDPMASREYKIYGQNIKLMLLKMRYMVHEAYEKMAKTFDYDTVDDPRIATEFLRFRESTAQTLMHTASQKITEEWVSIDILTRDECYQLNIPIIPKLTKEIADAIQRGLEVQIQYKQKLNALYKELEDYIKEGGNRA